MGMIRFIRWSFPSLVMALMLTGCFMKDTEKDKWLMKRQSMVESQIMARGIRDKNVLSAMLKVQRHLFVPAENAPYAYEDRPLAIGYGQTISQPYIVAYMTEILKLDKQDTVLEVGTGSGYQAAILAELAKEVYSVEILAPLAKEAEERLGSLGYTNIFIRHGDGYMGWEEHAPFDAIIITAAPQEIPKRLIDQMALHGRMIVPVGVDEQRLYLVTKEAEGIKTEELLPVRFVPMVKSAW